MISLTLLVGAVVGFLMALALGSDLLGLGASIIFGMIGASACSAAPYPLPSASAPGN